MKSEQIYQKALKYLPGGISRNTIYRKPYPFYVKEAEGCFVTDIDGNKRIDFANNVASLLHGHRHPEIIKAVEEQLKKGTAFTLATEIEVEYAEMLCNRVESFDQIRFVNSGTEAIMFALKAARAYTRKPLIAKAEGAYHGTYDFAEISEFASPENWGPYNNPNKVSPTVGTPQSIIDNVVIFPFNDLTTTLEILNRHKNQIACVLIDPIPHRVGFMPASEEFIKGIYEWTRQNGALMVFDEVVTFRVGYGGAQEYYSVKPDITAMGKAIGGGFPVGAIAGRAEVMNVFDPRNNPVLIPHSGTFFANPITLSAGYAAMKIYDQNAVDKLNKTCEQGVNLIKQAIKDADVPVCITGRGSLFRIHPRATEPKSYRQAYQDAQIKALVGEILDYMLTKENVILINTLSAAVSTVTTIKEFEHLANGFYNAFKHFKSKIEEIQKNYQQ